MSDENIAQNAVIKVAKENAVDRNPAKVHTLSTGYKARLRPVSASLISDVTANIADPEVPTFYNKDKDRDEPNPNDPSYLAALARAERERGQASIDAVIMFGVDLIDPLPTDDTWLKQLRYLEKRGTLNLSIYDFDDPMDLEFLFKRYVVIGNDDIVTIGKLSGLTQEAMQKAEGTF